MDLVRSRRIDTVPLARPVRRTDGSMLVQARAARTGVQKYRDDKFAGGWRREYRPDSEVGAPESLASMKLRPFTIYHPPVMVTPENASKYARGTSGETVWFDGKWVNVTFAVTTQDAIDALGHMNQISVGYDCDLDLTPGITPQGEHYDAIQRNIRANHFALVPDARAGADAAIRLDASVSVEESYEGATMNVYSSELTGSDLAARVRKALAGVPGITVTVEKNAPRVHEDSICCADRRLDHSVRMWSASAAFAKVTSTELTANQLTAVVQRALQSEFTDVRVDHKEGHMDTAALTASLTKALGDLAAVTARADAADLKLAELTKQLGTITAERDSQKERADTAEKSRNDAIASNPARVRERVTLEQNVRKVLGSRCDAADGKPPEIDLDNLSDRDARLAVIKHVTNSDALEAVKGRDAAYIEAYVTARYDAAIERAAAAGDTHRDVLGVINGHRKDATGPDYTDSKKKRDKARADMIAANRDSKFGQKKKPSDGDGDEY